MYFLQAMLFNPLGVTLSYLFTETYIHMKPSPLFGNHQEPKNYHAQITTGYTEEFFLAEEFLERSWVKLYTMIQRHAKWQLQIKSLLKRW